VQTRLTQTNQGKKQYSPIPHCNTSALLCSLGAAAALALLLIRNGLEHLRSLQTFFPQSDVPLLTRPDAFFHFQTAKDMLNAALAIPERPSLLLAHLVAWMSNITSIEWIALVLPPILATSMVGAVVPWLLHARQPLAAVGGALLCCCAPFWLERTQLGALDTDGLLPILVALPLFLLHRGSERPGRQRLFCLGSVTFLLILLHFWWVPGPYLLVPPILFFAICRLWEAPHRRRTSAVAASVLLLVLLALTYFTPHLFLHAARFIRAHIDLALGSGNQALTHAAIVELTPMPLQTALEASLGSWLFFPLPLLGLFFWMRRFGINSVYLIYLLVIGAGCLFAERFLLFGIPALGILTLYGLCTSLAPLFKRLAVPSKGSTVISGLAIALLLLPNLNTAWHFAPEPYYGPEDVRACELLRQYAANEDFIWTWWDYGYFVRALTGLEVYFDGGSQDASRLFTASYPLMHANPQLAAQWLASFAGRSGASLPPPGHPEHERRLNSQLQSLTHALPSPRQVWLYLPRRTFDASGYIYAFAHGLSFSEVVNRLDIFPAKGFDFTGTDGSVVVPQQVFDKGYRGFSAVLNGSPLSYPSEQPLNLPAPLLVYSKEQPFVAITDSQFIQTTMFQLLGLSGPVPGFEEVWFNYRHGGIWRVLPEKPMPHRNRPAPRSS